MTLPRDLEAIRHIALHRFLTRPQLEELLLADLPLTPRSRQVVAWRVLGRLQRSGYVAATARQNGGVRGGSGLPAYFLTARGLRVAASVCPDLPKHRPAARSAFLAPHSMLTTDIELALRRSARDAPEQALELWEADWQIALRLGERAVIPDARAAYSAHGWRMHLFIEADLGTEGTRFFARKVGRYFELYEGGAWRELVRTWPRIVTVTLTDARAALLQRATRAFLDARYGHWRRRLDVYLVAIDELQRDGVGVRCRSINDDGRHPLVDVEDLRQRATTPAPAPEPRTLERGRSGASGSSDDTTTPHATTQVDGLAR